MFGDMRRLAAQLVVLTASLGFSLPAAEFPDVVNEGMGTNHFEFHGSYPATDPGFSTDYTVVGSGGNPGSLLSVGFHYSDQNTGDAEQTFNVYTNFSWIPSVDGEIAALSFSIDLRAVPFDPLFDMIAFSVSDANGGSIAGFTSVPDDSGWLTVSVTNLTAANFSGRDFAGTLPLQFGISLIGPSAPPMTEFSAAIELDNFRVSVTTVPEPRITALIGVSGGLLALWKLRRRRQA